MQNDDWVYYLNLENFLSGNFQLHDLTAPTFYSQGLIAYIFTLIFGIQFIPALTVTVSLLCCFVFYRILRENLNLDKINSTLLTIIFGINPLFVYSAIGFMTENYFLLFILLSVKYFLDFEKKNSYRDFYISLLFGFLAFGSKQVGLFLPLGYALYLFIRGRVKEGSIAISTFFATYAFYIYLFPRTPEMLKKNLLIIDVLEIQSTVEAIFLIVIYVFALISPVVIAIFANRILGEKFRVNRDTFIKLAVIMSIVIAYVSVRPDSVGFLFFENSFNHRGFFPDEISGDKYYFRAFDEIFLVWEWLGIFAISVFLINLKFRNINSLSKFRARADPLLVCAVIYIFVIAAVDQFFDRYIFPIIPLIVIYLVKYHNIKNQMVSNIILIVSSVLIGFVSYNFAAEYIASNLYVWDKSRDITQTEGVNSTEINGSRAWNAYFKRKYSEAENRKFKFSFNETETDYILVSKEEMRFPGNFFLNPVIYLHRLDNE